MTATKTQDIKVKRIKEEGCTIELEITAGKELTAESFQNALIHVQSKARIPGFRQGKAPLSMLKQHYAGAIKEQALDIAVRKSVDLALESEKLNPVVTPVIKKLDFDENKPLSMELQIEVSPTVEPKKYTGAKVKRITPKVDAKLVDEEVERMLEYNSHLEASGPTAKVSEKNFVVVNYTGTKDGQAVKGFSSDGEMIDMSAPQTLAGLAEAITGAKKGETREFETEVAGTGKVKVSVTVAEIKKKVLPELNDEFAKKMGFDTVAALRERIEESLKKDAEAKSENDVIRQIEDHILKENEFAVPNSLVDHHVESSLRRFSAQMFGNADYKMPEAQKKNLSEKIRPNSERDLKVGYLIHAIARKENLIAVEADFEAELTRNLELARNDDEKKKTREFFTARRQDVLITLTERKVMEYLKQNSKITEGK